MRKWIKYMKRPAIIEARDPYPGEEYIETLEGTMKIHPNGKIVKGIDGEEYSVERSIFDRTYLQIDEDFPPAQHLETLILENQRLHMIFKLCKDYVASINTEGKLELICNDEFYFATADGEEVPSDEIENVYLIYCEEGYDGLMNWIAKRRGIARLA